MQKEIIEQQEIMQYTNPLRAKIMLFYMIYQIDPYEQHWSIVRTCSLDDLLIKLSINWSFWTNPCSS